MKHTQSNQGDFWSKVKLTMESYSPKAKVFADVMNSQIDFQFPEMVAFSIKGAHPDQVDLPEAYSDWTWVASQQLDFSTTRDLFTLPTQEFSIYTQYVFSKQGWTEEDANGLLHYLMFFLRGALD